MIGIGLYSDVDYQDSILQKTGIKLDKLQRTDDLALQADRRLRLAPPQVRQLVRVAEELERLPPSLATELDGVPGQGRQDLGLTYG